MMQRLKTLMLYCAQLIKSELPRSSMALYLDLNLHLIELSLSFLTG